MVTGFDSLFIKNYQKYIIPLDLINIFAVLSNFKYYVWKAIKISFKSQNIVCANSAPRFIEKICSKNKAMII